MMSRSLLLVLLPITLLPQAWAQQTDEPSLQLSGAYTGEVWSNLAGGLRRDAVYLSNLELAADLDAEREFGLAATAIHVSLLHNNRSTFSDRVVGDLQAVSNIDTDGSLRLKEIWIERAFKGFSVKAGLIDLNSEFDAIETALPFINSSFGIGPDFSQAGENGPSIFPITGLGLVVRIDLAEKVEFRVGLFEGTPGHKHRPRRMRFHLGDEGALLVGELGLGLGEDGRLAAGIWRLSDNLDRIDGGRAKSSGGHYVSLDKKILNLPRHSLSLFARAGFADPEMYQIASYQGAGILLSGPILGAKKEEIGLAIASARNGEAYRRAQALVGPRPHARETAIELTYRVQLTSFLSFQPDVQYILNPGTNPFVEDAFAVGWRTVMSWP